MSRELLLQPRCLANVPADTLHSRAFPPLPCVLPVLHWLLVLGVMHEAPPAAFIVKNRDSLPTGVPIVICCKGIENGSLLTPFEILEEELPGKVLLLRWCSSNPSVPPGHRL